MKSVVPFPGEVSEELKSLLDILPSHIRKELEKEEDPGNLIEIVLDLGRPPEARFLNRTSYFRKFEISREDIEPEHVEDFLDTTVEWLSGNPEKGILIDFNGVTSVCTEFTVALVRHYEEKGLKWSAEYEGLDMLAKEYLHLKFRR